MKEIKINKRHKSGSFIYSEYNRFKLSLNREITYLTVLCKCGKLFEIAKSQFDWGTHICKPCRDDAKPLKEPKQVKKVKPKKKIKFRKDELITFNGQKRTIDDICKEYSLNYNTIVARRKKGKVDDELFQGVYSKLNWPKEYIEYLKREKEIMEDEEFFSPL